MGNENHVSIGNDPDGNLVKILEESSDMAAGPATNEAPDEDVDVDILYMRLKALQSMKEKLDQEDDEMVEEMEELLQEADQAANEVEEVEDDYSDYVPATRIHDVDEAGLDIMMRTSLTEDNLESTENNDDNMSSLVKRLKEAARKTKAAASAANEHPVKDSQENYSPTQSPIRDVSNDDNFDIIDLIDADRASSPTTDDDEPVIVFSKPKPVEVVDLELETTEAEVQFFKQQREEPLFPASVWEFQPQKTTSTRNESDDATKASIDDNLEAFHMAVMAQSKTVQKFRRKRARSRGKSQSVSEERQIVPQAEILDPENIPLPPPTKSARKTEENSEEADEKALRAAVLSSMAVKRTKKIEIEEKNKALSGKLPPDEPQKAPTPPPLPPIAAPAPAPKPAPPPNVPAPSTAQAKAPSAPKYASILKAKKAGTNRVKKMTLAEKKKQLEAKKKLALKKVKAEKDLKNLKDELSKYEDKSIKNKIGVMPLARKYFPNLFMRKVLIPFKDLIDGEDEEIKASKTPESVQFQKSLDDFMKGIRFQSKKSEEKAKPPPKPVRKFPPKKTTPNSTVPSAPTKAKGATAVAPKKAKEATVVAGTKAKEATKPYLRRSLSIADKESLKKNDISHLPPDKQLEYKKLLVLLAQKEKAKKTQKANNSKDLTVSINKDSETRKVKQNQPKRPIQGKPTALKVVEVPSVPQKLAPISNPTLKILKEKEAELISSRKSMSASLFKLSAEVSQLKEETSKKETAEAFLEKLQSQVAVTIELIAKKNERINKLKTVVRESHLDVVTKNDSMAILKKQCKSMGVTLKGTSYQTPQEGMDLIRKKLSVINSSAKKVATNDVVNGEAPKTSDKVKEAIETVKDSSDDSSSSSSDSDDDSDSEDSDTSSSESSSDNDEENIEEKKSSSLAHLSKPSVVLDPQIELCRFDLQGRCNDKTCPYQHLGRPSPQPSSH